MNIDERQLHSGMEYLRLTPEEKGAMRTALMAHMRRHPQRGAASSWQWLLAPRFAAPALVVLLCASTAYAAEGALPGDPLYAVKVHVNETVAGALAVSDSAKASWNADLAAERVVEAQRLAAENRLTAATSEELQSDFEAHASAAAHYTDTVAKDDPAASVALQAELTAVNAEGAVLAQIGNEGKDKQTKENALAFADHVRASASLDAEASAPAAAAPMMKALIAPAAEPAQATDTATTSDEDASAAAAAKAQATDAFLALQKKYHGLQGSLSTSTTKALDAKITAIQNELAAGDAASSSEDALAYYRRALSVSVTLTTFLKADAQFHGKDLLSSLLHLDEDSSEDGTKGSDHSLPPIRTPSSTLPGSSTPILENPRDPEASSTPVKEGSTDLPLLH